MARSREDPRIEGRVKPELLAQFKKWCKAQGLKRADAERLALERLIGGHYEKLIDEAAGRIKAAVEIDAPLFQAGEATRRMAATLEEIDRVMRRHLAPEDNGDDRG